MTYKTLNRDLVKAKLYQIINDLDNHNISTLTHDLQKLLKDVDYRHDEDKTDFTFKQEYRNGRG